MLPVAILAGGLATRLRPLTETIPKSLVEVAGEPFIGIQLRLLRDQGIRRAVVCAGYLGEMLQDYVGSGERFGVEVSYSFDGETLRGTAGAILNALPQLGDAFFVLYGDSYLPCDFAAVADAFHRSGEPALMTVYRNEGAWDSSNVEFADGRIAAYDKQHRTERMRHIDYGLGVFSAEVFRGLDPGRAHDLAVVYQRLLAENRLAAFEISQRFYEIGSFNGIRELSEYLAQ